MANYLDKAGLQTVLGYIKDWVKNGFSRNNHNHDDRYVKKSGDTMTGKLIANGRIAIPCKGLSWVEGKDLSNLPCYITNKASDSWSPIIGQMTKSSYVWNLGTIQDTIHFVGFWPGRTTDSVDWRHYVDAKTGEIYFGKTIYATNIYASGNISGNFQGTIKNAINATNIYVSKTSGDTSYYVTGITDSAGANKSLAAGTAFYFNSTGAFWNSDVKLKHNITNINKGDVNQFFTYNYFKEFTWNSSYAKSWGVIAQEIENWAPEAVNEENGIKSVNYDVVEAKAIAALTEKVKQQEKEINKIKKLIKKCQ